MKADPKVGDSYRQEYYQGEAEDMADVVSLEETVIVPFGTFTNCLKTRDWSKIDSNLIVIAGGEKVELVDVGKRN